MVNSKEFEESQQRNVEQRREFIKYWAEYVRTHDDEEWSRQQNTLIDSQIETANDLAESGETDPVRFAKLKDRLREQS